MRSHEFFDVRMKGFRDRCEVADALQLLDARLAPLPGETAALRTAAGRVLALAVTADVAVPPYDRAAMDGYAVRAEDTFGASGYAPRALQIMGVAFPARPFVGSVGTGQAVRVMTGAPMPNGADAVLPAEDADEAAGVVQVREPVPPHRHVGRCGEDVAPGQVVLKAGRVLRPQDLALLASIGVARVVLVRRPEVAILATGDELLPVGQKPHGCQIVDSNSIMLAALIERDGAVVARTEMVPDQRDKLSAALRHVPGDVVFVTGGTSVGQEDHAPSLIAELGELAVHGLALRPAAPTGIGFVGGKIVFLLPGNPVSCLCAYDLLAGRALRRLGGRPLHMPYRVRRLPLAAKIVSAIGRVDYVRVGIEQDRVIPLAVSGAAILTTTTRADGFVLVERDLEGYGPGAEVDVYLYDA